MVCFAIVHRRHKIGCRTVDGYFDFAERDAVTPQTVLEAQATRAQKGCVHGQLGAVAGVGHDGPFLVDKRQIRIAILSE
jgi:hypothetical protein